MNAMSNEETVLVVDDSPETLSMINDTLERSGLTCLVSIDPLQGLKIAKKMLPDLILLDGLMPNMSGFEFCEICKANIELQDIPIIFMTGLSDSDDIVKGFDVGGVDYVTKPIDTSSLISRIRAHLLNAKRIRSTQRALDQSGQHVFSVNHQGSLIWQTPDVHQSLSRISKETIANTQKDWVKSIFWPAIEKWIQSGHDNLSGDNLSYGLQLHCDNNIIKLDVLNNNISSSEFLIRLQECNQQNDCAILRDAFGLSVRESDVLFWIAQGKTNREMGYILGISPRTINKHLEQVFKKLEVDNRTNAAAKAIPVLNHS